MGGSNVLGGAGGHQNGGGLRGAGWAGPKRAGRVAGSCRYCTPVAPLPQLGEWGWRGVAWLNSGLLALPQCPRGAAWGGVGDKGAPVSPS